MQPCNKAVRRIATYYWSVFKEALTSAKHGVGRLGLEDDSECYKQYV